MLGRLVNKIIDEKNKDYKYVWGNFLPTLQNNDLNIINLETTLTNNKKKVPKVFNFRASPDKVACLSTAKIDVVNIANNHILDYGIKGLEETLFTLDKAKILHTGAGLNKNQAKRPVIINKKNIKIAIIGYTDNEPSWIAGINRPGTNYIKVGDINKIEQDIKAIRNQVDIIIVSIHWGPNMRQKPNRNFINFAHKIIDLGADIIHGHSAHIFQAVEIYKNKIIMYDTGDFIDDYAIDKLLRNDQSFLFCIKLNKSKIISIELIPAIISNMQVNKAKGQSAKNIINKMKKLSLEFNTKFTEKNNRLILNL